jgi:hypothetical protein
LARWRWGFFSAKYIRTYTDIRYSFQSIAPLLIIFRVLEGTAWSKDTARLLAAHHTEIRFAKQNISDSVGDGSTGIVVKIVADGRRNHDEESVISDLMVGEPEPVNSEVV